MLEPSPVVNDPRNKPNTFPDLVPDLDLPVRGPASGSMNSAKPAPAVPRSLPPKADLGDALDGFGGVEIERGAMSAPPASGGARVRSDHKQIAIDMAAADGSGFGDDEMEIERGGGTSLPPNSTGRPPHSGGRPHVSAAPRSGPGGGSGLEVSYSRPSARVHEEEAPSILENVLAYALSIIVFSGTIAGLVKLVHHQGSGRSVTRLLPHAFDATSSIQSGAVALSSLAVAIGLGYAGFKMRPRSIVIALSGVIVFLAAIAMVTVTLVSTDDNPMPPDGALVIPYVVPLALLLLGFGTLGRAVHMFLDGGVRRVATIALGVLGGAFAFAAIEFSTLASRLPF